MTLMPAWDLVCYSHLRWNSVFQRPHHLMTRCATERRVYFIEEPICEDGVTPHLDIAVERASGSNGSATPPGQNGSLAGGESRHARGLFIVVPRLPAGLGMMQQELLVEQLLFGLFADARIDRHVAWYYTPMALGFTRQLTPDAIVYDCMDELSAFLGAPPILVEREAALLRRAGVVFTGGQSLYEAKRDRHHNAHAFPSSIDAIHFAKARRATIDPGDQADLAHPRIGFAGVIDERMDLLLLRDVASARPEWQFVMLGPVVKIDPASLPRLANIHYLGQKPYAELPAYLSGWDVAWLPFARNEATRFISPTKTPEYLAAGRPVVSTSIRDVVRPYGERGLVRIADAAPDVVAAMEAAMQRTPEEAARRERADTYIADMSWDRTWRSMLGHLEALVHGVPAAARTQRRRESRVIPGLPGLSLEPSPDAVR